jgi:hypothetical protein
MAESLRTVLPLLLPWIGAALLLVVVLPSLTYALLLRVLPVMLLLEPLYLIIALRDGWAREKVRAWGWLARRPATVASRRRRVQAAVTDAHALDGLLTPEVTQTQLDSPKSLTVLNRALALYWRVVRPRSEGG